MNFSSDLLDRAVRTVPAPRVDVPHGWPSLRADELVRLDELAAPTRRDWE